MTTLYWFSVTKLNVIKYSLRKWLQNTNKTKTCINVGPIYFKPSRKLLQTLSFMTTLKHRPLKETDLGLVVIDNLYINIFIVKVKALKMYR